MRILVADDSPSFTKMMVNFLKNLGHSNVDCAYSIRDVKRLTSENSYDIVFLDYYLPDGKGCDIGREIMRLGRAKRVVLISVSGELPCEDMEILEKPVTLKDIEHYLN